MFKKVYKPLSLQHYCMAMLDYNTKIMIEIQHGRQLRIVLDLANSSRDGQKLVQGHVESFLRYQCLDNFFEIEPPIVNNKGTTKKPLQAKTTEKGLEVKKVGLTLCIWFLH